MWKFVRNSNIVDKVCQTGSSAPLLKKQSPWNQKKVYSPVPQRLTCHWSVSECEPYACFSTVVLPGGSLHATCRVFPTFKSLMVSFLPEQLQLGTWSSEVRAYCSIEGAPRWRCHGCDTEQLWSHLWDGQSRRRRAAARKCSWARRGESQQGKRKREIPPLRIHTAKQSNDCGQT